MTKPHRGRVKVNPTHIAVQQRRRFALQLAAVGLSYEEIADRVRSQGLGSEHYSRQSAWRDCVTAQDRLTEQPARELTALQQAQLNELIRSWMPKALGGDEKGADVVLKCMTRLARLRGLDAPAKLDITQHLSTLSDVFMDAMRAGLDAAELTEEQQEQFLAASKQRLRAVEAADTPSRVIDLPAALEA